MKRVNDIRLFVHCTVHPEHSKVLPIGSFVSSAPEIRRIRPAPNYPAERTWKIYFARRIGEILCGNSGLYRFPPGAGSPIGRCAVCGGALEFDVQDENGQKIHGMEEADGADLVASGAVHVNGTQKEETGNGNQSRQN